MVKNNFDLKVALNNPDKVYNDAGDKILSIVDLREHTTHLQYPDRPIHVTFLSREGTIVFSCFYNEEGKFGRTPTGGDLKLKSRQLTCVSYSPIFLIKEPEEMESIIKLPDGSTLVFKVHPDEKSAYEYLDETKLKRGVIINPTPIDL